MSYNYFRASASVIGASSTFDSGRIGATNPVIALNAVTTGTNTINLDTSTSAGTGTLTLKGNATNGITLTTASGGTSRFLPWVPH